MTTLEAQLQENDAPRTQLAGLRLNYMHEMQAYQASIAHRAATAEQIEQSIVPASPALQRTGARACGPLSSASGP